MKSPTAVIAEDEPELRAELRESLAVLWPELDVVVEAEDGIQAMRALHLHAPELMFLDIDMPGMTGLEVAAQASRRCTVAFVTAHDRYAVAAFEQGAVDYVLKPFSPTRLSSTVERLKERLDSRPADLSALLQALARGGPAARKYLRWVRASQGQCVRLIAAEDVLFFQADSKYTTVVTATGEALMRKTIAELAAELDPELFWQIHRSTIVNLSEVASVHSKGNGTLEARLKRHPTVLAVSATYAPLFKQM